MKNIALFLFTTLLFLSSCSDNSGDNKTPKKRDQPNLEGVTPTAKKQEEISNRKPSSPEHLEKAKSIISAVSGADISAVNAKQTFKNYCAICHGTTGDLNVNGATDLTTSTLSLEERVAQVYHGRGLMTPFNGLLKDNEIVAVTKYLEDLRK